MNYLKLLFLIGLVNVSQAATYYVRKDGNNINTGTSNTSAGAWLTLAKATSIATAGDTVNIGAGDWDEALTVAAIGTDVSPIVFQGAGDTTVIGVTTISGRYIHLKNYKAGPTATNVGSFVIGNSANLTKTAPPYGGDYCLAENISFTRVNGQQLGVGNNGFFQGPIGVTIKNCRFTNPLGGNFAINFKAVDSFIVDCYFTSNTGADAITLFGYRNTIRNCKFENWTRPVGSSLHCDLFQAFTNNGEESMDHIIENNFMINCTPGCQLGIVSDISLSGKAGGWTFRNNVIVNQAAPFYIQTPNHKFYNNTLVRSPTEQSQQFLLYYTADRGIANNTTFYNNIFYKGGSNPASTSGGFYDKTVAGAISSSFKNQILNLVSDYNLFYGENGTAKVSTTLNENNGNINSVNPGNPLFVNEFGTTKEDFKLQAGSAAIGKGVALNNLYTTDTAGTTRGATWDIGAFEFTAGTLPTTYYVRKDGNDSNTGTSNTSTGAWLTLGKSVTVAMPGDTIVLGVGEWEELITTVRHGQSGNPIVWTGQGDTTKLGGITALHDYIHIKNAHVGPIGTFAGTVNFGSSTLNNNKAVTVGNYGLAENILFTRTTGQQSGVAPNRYLYTGPVGVIWRNCRFLNAAGGAIPALGVQGVNCIVEGCYFSSSAGADSIGLFGRNNIIRNNKWERWSRPIGSTLHVDIFQAFSSNGETSIGHIIENNVFLDCFPGCQWGHVEDQALSDNVRDWTFRNNVVIRMAAPLTVYAKDFKIYNNTFYLSATEQSIAILIRASFDRGRAERTRIFNNIFYKGGNVPTSGGAGYYGFYRNTNFANTLTADPIAEFFGDNNLVIGVGTGLVKTGTWTSYGANANGLNGVDPLFVFDGDVTSENDLRLQAGSPAIGAALPLNDTFTTDASGVVRGTSWDIGAYEYAADILPVDTIAPTIINASINSQGNLLTVEYSENVKDVTAIHYNLTTGSLSAVTGSGNIRSFTISPIIQSGAVITLNYTQGNTADISSNLQASVTGITVINNSYIISEIYKNRKGRLNLARP